MKTVLSSMQGALWRKLQTSYPQGNVRVTSGSTPETYDSLTGRLRDDKSRNESGSRVAREWLKVAAVFLLIFTLGVGNVWGTTVTYTVSTTSAVTKSNGTAPTNSTTSFSTTGSKLNNSNDARNGSIQMTSGKTTTLTLSGWEGYKITGLVLNMASNAGTSNSNKTNGTFSLVAGSTTLAAISENTTFNNWYDRTAYSTSLVDVTVSLTNDDYEIQEDEDVVITITCGTKNSLYVMYYTITYEEAESTPSTYTLYLVNSTCSSVGSYSANQTQDGTETFSGVTYKKYPNLAENTSVTITASAQSGYQFDGWTDQGSSIIQQEESPYYITPSSSTSTTATFSMPASDVWIYTCNFSSASSSTYDITYHTACGTNPSKASGVSSVTLPTISNCDCPQGWQFAGWCTYANSSSPTAQTTLTGTYSPTDDVDLYAVYKKSGLTNSTYSKFGNSTLSSGNYLISAMGNGAMTCNLNSSNYLIPNTNVTGSTSMTTDDVECVWYIKNNSTTFTIQSVANGKWLKDNGSGTFSFVNSEASATNWYLTVTGNTENEHNYRFASSSGSTGEIAIGYASSLYKSGRNVATNPSIMYLYSVSAGNVSTSYSCNPTCTQVYNVTYVANTDDTSVANMPSDNTDYANGANVSISSTTPTRTGYTFDKWFTDENCTTPAGGYAAGKSNAFTISANTVLYAHWTIHSNRVDVTSVDHITYTATPASGSAIAEGAYANVDYGKTVTLTHTSLDAGYTIEWDAYNTNTPATKVTITNATSNNATFTMPDYPVTVTVTVTPPYVYFTECDDDNCANKYCINSYKTGGNGMTCFTDQGSNVWTITNYAIPATGQSDRQSSKDFWVGYDGVFVDGKSANWMFRWTPFKTLSGVCNTYKLGIAAQAVGTLTINAATSGNNNNYELTFDPNGYGFCYGTDPSWQTPLAFTRVGVTNVWNTSKVNVSDVISHNYYVGISKSGGGYVFSSDYDYNDDDEHIQGISQVQTISGVPVVSDVTSNPVAFRGSNLSSSDNGMRGYFQIWTDNCNRNFYCHFVPVYTITYKSYDGSSTLYTDEVSAGQSFTVRSAETGANGWAESASQSSASSNYTVGNSYTPTGNVTLYVALTAYTVSYTATSGTIERESVTVSSDVVIAGNTVTLPTVTGSSLTCAKFLGWYAGDYNNASKPTILAAGSTYTPNDDVTLKAIYAIVGDNYELVTDKNDLASGSQVVFVYRGWDDNFEAYYPVAMSETQQTDYRDVYDWQNSKVSLNATGTIISWVEATPDVAEFTVEAGSSNGTFAFYADKVRNGSNEAINPGYIYCASSSSNAYFRTQSNKNADASWSISIANGEATMVSQKDMSTNGTQWSTKRNVLMYNSSNDRWCCYASNYAGKKPSIFQRAISNYTTSPACTTYSISTCSPAPSNGTIQLSASTVSPGGYVTVTFTPSANYMLDAVTVTSGTANTPESPVYTSGPTSGGTVRINNIQSDITVCATFKSIPLYTVTFVDMDNNNSYQTVTQGSFGADVTTPSVANTSSHDPCDNTWTFVGWAPSNTLNGGTTAPTGFVAKGQNISGASIDDDKTYYSVYTNSSDGTTNFTIGKSGNYYIYALDGVTKHYATTWANATKLYEHTTDFTTNPKSVLTLTYNSTTGKYKIYNTTVDGSGNDKSGFFYQASSNSNDINVNEESSYTEFTITSGTASGSYRITYNYTTSQGTKTGNFGYGNGFKGYAAGYDVYFEPATQMYYYNASNCTDLVTMTFHPIAGGDPTWADGHPKAEYTDVAKGTISTFPTDAQEGWTFLGWTAGQSYNDNREAASETLDDDNASTTVPTQTIYSTGGNSYSLQSDIDMYPVFTKFADNEPFDNVNGGDYYIYYVADGDIGTSQDTYGANNRIYASGRSNNAYEVTSNCNNAALFTFTKLPNGKWTIYDNKNSGSGGKHYVCGEQTGSGNDLPLEVTATAANYGEWTITVVSGNQVQMTCFDNYMLQANSTNATSGSIKNYASNNYSSDPAHYHRVYLGTCTERVYSSDPTNNPRVEIHGTIKVTSTAGVSVKATNALTVSANNISTNTITITSNNSAFKFSDSSSGSYSASLNISVVNNKVGITPVYVEYTPAAGSTSDGIDDAIIAVSDGAVTPTTASTESGDVQGRHLPAKFLIATKVDDNWYALPNNTGTYGNPAGIKLSSVNETTGVATYYSDEYEGEAVGSKNYLTWTLNSVVSGSNADYGYNNHGNRVRFYDSKNSKYLEAKASDDDIKNSIASPTASDHPLCEFLPMTSDLVDYTLKNEGQVKFLGVDGSAWGLYAGSTTVRFLIPNQQPAPTITWRNDSRGADYTTSKAENGVVTAFPSTGTNPTPCDAASNVLTWVSNGWVTETWSGYRTTGFTQVNVGDAVASDKTYYALFKTDDNKYFTQCPNIQTVTYSDGAEPANTVVESYFVDCSGKQISCKEVGTGSGQINFTKSGYVFVGWTTSNNYGSAFKYAGNPVTLYASSCDKANKGDLVLTAVWAGALAIEGDVHLTSTYTSTSASKANTVFTTAEIGNLITVTTSAPAEASLAIRVSYLDNNDVTAVSCPFHLCYYNHGGSHDNDYNYADGGNISVSGASYSQTFAIGYKPTSAGGGNGREDTYKLKLELVNSGGDKVFSTAELTMHGRVLPNKFVIAAQIGGQWRALPADIAQSSAHSIQDAYQISVNAGVTQALAAPKKAIYTATVRYHEDHKGGIRLTTAVGDGKDGQLQATRSDNAYLWRTTSDCTTGMQEWYLVSSDFSNYEIRLDPTIKRTSTESEDGADAGTYVTRQLCVNGNQILFGTTNAKTFRILPVTAEYEPVDMQVVEWKSTGVVFMYLGNPDYEAEVEIGGVTKASAAELSTLRVDKGVYEIAVSDLMSSVNQAMYIIIKNGGTEVGRKQVMVPLLVNTTTTVNTARTGAGISDKNNCKNIDLVVLSPSVLTADDATAHQFKTISVYGGAKLVVSSDKALTALDGMYLRAGTVTSGTYQYVYPQVYIGSGATLTVPDNIINFDYLTTKSQYYALALPYGTTINNTNIFYPEDIYGSYKTGSYLMDVFNSATRASQGAVDAVWEDKENVVPTRGQGYYFLGMPRKMSINGGTAERQEYGIQRIKMNITSAESLATSENTNASIRLTYYASDQLYNAGWNLLGNPFMADLSSGETDGVTGNICSNLTFSENTWSNDKAVRYVTVPNDEAMETYDQRMVKDYDFPAFKTFYVQIGATGDITFSKDRRSSAKPARFMTMTTSQPDEIEFSIALNPSVGAGDTTHLLLGEAFSNDYEIGDDLQKMSHSGLSLFTVMNGVDLFANAIPVTTALSGIPVGYTAPESGNLTFSVNDKEDYTWIKHLWLVDHDLNTKTDLLIEDYPFTTDAETNRTRFTLNTELKTAEEVNTTTDVESAEEVYSEPEKFIYDGKLYIWRNSVIYDATGKKVREINK